MLNSAVGARATYERRSSASRIHPRGSVRQVEPICDPSEDSSSSHDVDESTPAVRRATISGPLEPSNSKSVSIAPRRTEMRRSRRRSSFHVARQSIAKRLRIQMEREGGDGDIENPSDSWGSEEGSPERIRTDTLALSRRATMRQSFAHQKPPWFILFPHNKFRLGWDIFMAWLLFLFAFYVPYRVCLYWNDETPTSKTSNTLYVLELCADISFAIDIVLNFITAHYDASTKSLVTNPRAIAKRYIRGFFFLDLIATFPFTYILTNTSLGLANKIGKLGRLPKMMRFLRAARLLKLLRVYKLQQFIIKLEVQYNIHHGVSRMAKIVVTVMLVTHLVGCFWYLVGLSGGEDTIDGGWMFRYGYNNFSTEAQYVASLYWAFSTLTTVGYGDINARTSQEQAYSMLMMLLGVSWYAYVVSSMSTIMSTFDAQNKAVRDKLVSVNEFLRAAKLPRDLSKRVRDFFEFKLSNSQRAFLMSKHYDADELLDELGSGLRSDILLFMDRQLVEKIPFFKNKVPQFVADTISMFQPHVFQEGDFIVKEGTQADEMFFLVKGKAGVYYGDKHAVTIEDGSYFGEIGCIMGGIRRAGIKAMTTCELQALSRRNLNILLAEYPEVAEELKSVAKYRAKMAKSEPRANGAEVTISDKETAQPVREEKNVESKGPGSTVETAEPIGANPLNTVLEEKMAKAVENALRKVLSEGFNHAGCCRCCRQNVVNTGENQCKYDNSEGPIK